MSVSPSKNNKHTTTDGLYVWDSNKLIEATQSLNSQWHNNNPPKSDTHSCVISTDTRTISQNDIFLALSGDNFDGHDYLETAVNSGANVLIVSKPNPNIHVPQLVVTDTRKALGALAAYRRQQHQTVKIIAITGSSGKTTCKEMLRSIFDGIAPTLITRGNLNNDLGVPMMMLELKEHHRFAILELGANHVGEIAYTSNIVDADVACILNIGTAHLGEFGGRDNISKTKAEIYQSLTTLDTAVVPENDDYANGLLAVAKQYTDKIIKFGKTDVFASNIVVNNTNCQFTLHIGEQSNDLILPLAGVHNVENALAVSACATALNISINDIITGLSQVTAPKGRLYRKEIGHNVFIDDTYNANPNSVIAAANVLASYTKHCKILVLGDIGELGESANYEHEKLGSDISKLEIDYLLTCGDLTKNTVKGAVKNKNLTAKSFDSKTNLLDYLKNHLHTNIEQPTAILFKGSRYMKMETIFNALIEE